MKRLLFTASLALSAATFAQTNSGVSGVIQDANTKDAVPFGTVQVLNQNNKLVKGAVADVKGRFLVKGLPKGKYKLVTSFVGYQSDTIASLTVGKKRKKLSAIYIKPKNIALGEVLVTGNQSLVKSRLDRKTYATKDFKTASGGNAIDVLNKLPSVSVSPDGLEVSVRGTNSFMVYLNGKPTQMDASTLLTQISADVIKNIDVITVPSAKYEAQGKGGIINISTKGAAVQGLTISTFGTLGYSPWIDKTERLTGRDLQTNKYVAGVNLMYGWKNLSLYGGVSYNEKNTRESRTGAARILHEQDNSFLHMVAGGERDLWDRNVSANAGLDYKFSDNTKLSLSYTYADRKAGRIAYYIYHNFYGDADQNPMAGVDRQEEWIFNPNRMDRKATFNTCSADFTHKWGESNTFTASAILEDSKLTHLKNNRNFLYDKATETSGDLDLQFKQKDTTPLEVYTFNVNNEWTRDNGDVINVGLQPQFFQMDGGFKYDVLNMTTGELEPNTRFYNGIDLERQIHAGYIDYAGKAGKFQYMAGLRLEYTNQTMEVDNPAYFNIFDRETKGTYEVNQLDWFPSLHLQYDLSDKTKFNLAASRRIDRPKVKEMAPFLYRNHLEVYQVGDPALKPEFVNNLELGWDQYIGKQKINVTAFYRGVSDAVFRVNTIFPEEMTLVRSYTNSGDTRSLGLELNGNFTLGKRMKAFLGGSLYNYRVKADIFGYQENNSSTNWNVKGNTNINICKGLNFNADFDVKSSTVTAQGENDLIVSTNAALSYSPQKVKNLHFTLKALNVFDTVDKGLNTRAFDSNRRQIFYQETTYQSYGPVLELSVSYSINPMKTKKVRTAVGNKEF